MPLWLIGMMGTGKTTVGSLVADRLGIEFIDLDRNITENAGQPIKDIFASEGEASFRQREADALRRAAAISAAVVATGGGAVLDPENRRLMKASGSVVWLRGSVDTLKTRIGDAQQRPLLQTTDVTRTLSDLLEERTPAYEAAADYTVETDDLQPAEIAAIVEAIWNA
jgi:shikimate kinase